MIQPNNTPYSSTRSSQSQLSARQTQKFRKIEAAVDSAILSIAAQDGSFSDIHYRKRGEVLIKERYSSYEDETMVHSLTYDPKHPPTQKNPTQGVTRMCLGDGFDTLHFTRLFEYEYFTTQHKTHKSVGFCRNTITGAIKVV